MRVIEPSFEITTPFGDLTPAVGVSILKYIERMARISHRSESGQTEDSWKRFIQAVVLEHGDWSVVEHAALTVIFRVDRGITHEIVRHRLASYTQESTRFVNYAKKGADLEFIRPIEWDGHDNFEKYNFIWARSVAESERDYLDLLAIGARPQAARSILAPSLASTLAMTSNLRNWRLFFMSRITQEAHPDLKRVTVPLLAEFKRCIPLLFDDIEPNAKQSRSLAKIR